MAYRLAVEATEMAARLERNYRYSLGEDIRKGAKSAVLAITLAGKGENRADNIRYVGNKCLMRMERKMAGWEDYPPEHPVQSINSFLGITSHYRAYNIRKRWIYGPLRFSFQEGYYTRHILTYKQQQPRPFENVVKMWSNLVDVNQETLQGV